MEFLPEKSNQSSVTRNDSISAARQSSSTTSINLDEITTSVSSSATAYSSSTDNNGIDTKSSSSNNTNMDVFRRRLKLMKLQLRQREAEIDKLNSRLKPGIVDTETALGLNEDIKALCEGERHLREKMDDLSDICHTLLQLNDHQVRNSEDRIEDRIETIKVQYAGHIETMVQKLKTADTQLIQLKAQMTDNDVKVSAKTHEIAFLRSENEYLRDETESLKKQLISEQCNCRTLQSDVADLKMQLKSVSKTVEISSDPKNQYAMDQRLYEVKSLKRQLNDQKAENEQKVCQMRAKMDYIEKESDRGERFRNQLSTALSTLTADNQKLLNLIQALREGNFVERMEYEKSVAGLEQEKLVLKTKLDSLKMAYARLKSAVGDVQEVNQMDKMAQELENAKFTIQLLQKQVDEMTQSDEIGSRSSRDGLILQLRNKCKELIEVRAQMGQLNDNCRKLQTENDKWAVLLVEMSRDMRSLLDIQRQFLPDR